MLGLLTAHIAMDVNLILRIWEFLFVMFRELLSDQKMEYLFVMALYSRIFKKTPKIKHKIMLS